MTFAEQLKAERGRIGLTQAEAAALLEISPRTLWTWEKGEEPTTIEREGAIAILKRTKVKK